MPDWNLILLALLVLATFMYAFVTILLWTSSRESITIFQRIEQTYEDELEGLKEEIALLSDRIKKLERTPKRKGDSDRLKKEELAIKKQREARLERKQQMDEMKQIGKFAKWLVKK